MFNLAQICWSAKQDYIYSYWNPNKASNANGLHIFILKLSYEILDFIILFAKVLNDLFLRLIVSLSYMKILFKR